MIGKKVKYWKMVKRGEPSGVGVVTAGPRIMCGSEVVWIEGCSGCIATSHVVEVIEDKANAVPNGEE